MAIGLAVVSVLELLVPVDTYAAAALGVLAIGFGADGLRRARDGERGAGMSWFGVITGFISVAVAAFVYLYPGALNELVFSLF